MIKSIVCSFVFSLFVLNQAFAFGLTADQLYRNMLFSEGDKSETSIGMPEEPILSFRRPDSEKVNSADKQRAANEVAEVLPKQKWNDIVVSVKKGNVSPFDLAEIRRKSEREDPEAVELLAWMYAVGIGIKQDLQKSYAYYLQAAQMGVPSAYDNVRAVYKAMSPSEKEALPIF